MDICVWLAEKYELTLSQRSPIEIPNVGRKDLARLFRVWGFQCGVEVGVEQGEFSEILCEQNPGVRLYCVDAWEPYHGYRDHVGAEKLEGFYVATRARLARFSGAKCVRKFSADAARDVKNGSLDFVYLDGNHAFEFLTADLAAWTPKVRPGGIIAGHDWVRYKWPNRVHVMQVIPAWTDAYEIEPWFVLGTQAKVEGEIRDTARSWFWVNQPRSTRTYRGSIKQ